MLGVIPFAVPFRTRQQTTARSWCIARKTVKQPVRTRLNQARSLCSWPCSQVEPLCASSNDINRKCRERCDIEPSTTALNNTTVVFWYGRWVLVWLMVVATDTCGWSAMWYGEMIVQTCTTEGSVDDVAKSVSCARNKTWPGENKVSEFPWRLRERRCLSVSSPWRKYDRAKNTC